MPGRWPIHPRPYAAEALSSWVNRLAAALGAYSASELLQYEFGIALGRQGNEWLDYDPPPMLIDGLAARTGEDCGAVQAMTARGYVPLLIDRLGPGAFDDYVGQFSLLLPAGRRKPQGSPVIPWYDPKRFAAPHGCGRCLQEDASPYLRLSWRFSWMATCPVHRAVLVPVWQLGGPCRVAVPSATAEEIRVPALPEQVAVDAMTQQAVTTGHCYAPHGRMHGGAWLRLLRSVVQEVTLAPSRAGRRRPNIERCWAQLGLKYEAPHRWPFERLPVARQVTVLNVAAVALARELLRTHASPGAPASPCPTSASSPPTPGELMESCIAEFRVSPASVAAFRRMIGAMDRSGAQLEKVDLSLTAIGIAIPPVTKPLTDGFTERR